MFCKFIANNLIEGAGNYAAIEVVNFEFKIIRCMGKVDLPGSWIKQWQLFPTRKM